MAGPSWRVGEAGGSLNRETPGRVGAAATKSGRPSTAGWVGPGERDGTVYVRNRCCKASSSPASSNPVDVGWYAVRTRAIGGDLVVGWSGNSWEGLACLAWEVTVKVYGVAVTMPQGQSRAPRPSIETQ